jgi:hypothetical protein
LSQLLIKHGKDFLEPEFSIKKGFVSITAPPLSTGYNESLELGSGPIFCSWVVKGFFSGAIVVLILYAKIVQITGSFVFNGLTVAGRQFRP